MYVKGSREGREREPACWVPWSGATCVMLGQITDVMSPRCFLLWMRQLRGREGVALAPGSQSAPCLSVLILHDFGLGRKGVALISSSCMTELGFLVDGGFTQDPQALGDLEEALGGWSCSRAQACLSPA